MFIGYGLLALSEGSWSMTNPYHFFWNYLKVNKWSKSKDLTLSRCVDDILNTSDLEYKNYIKNKMSSILGGVK